MSCPALLELCTKKLGLYRDYAKNCHVIWEQTSEKQDSWKIKLSVLNKHNSPVSTHKIHTNWILRCWENILMDLSFCIRPSSYMPPQHHQFVLAVKELLPRYTFSMSHWNHSQKKVKAVNTLNLLVMIL